MLDTFKKAARAAVIVGAAMPLAGCFVGTLPSMMPNSGSADLPTDQPSKPAAKSYILGHSREATAPK